MRAQFTTILTLSLLAVTPALAGNLTFDNGQTSWHSTQCVAPTPPPSVYHANPETGGDEMNDLVNQHNAYVDQAQTYMNCVTNEAEHDQSLVSQQISANAQNLIAQVQQNIDADAQRVRDRRARD